MISRGHHRLVQTTGCLRLGGSFRLPALHGRRDRLLAALLQPGGTQWAGGDGGDDRAPGGTWVAYSFDSPATVQCVRISHSDAAHQQMLNVLLQWSVDGVGWNTFDVLEFDSGPEGEVGSCNIFNACPTGSSATLTGEPGTMRGLLGLQRAR